MGDGASSGAVVAHPGGWLRLRTPLSRWVVAIAAPVLLTSLFAGVVDEDLRVGTAYVALVVLVGVTCGPLPAVLSLALSTVGFWYVVVPPTRQLDLVWPEGPVSIGVLVVAGAAVIGVIAERDRRAAQAIEFERRYRRLSDAGIVGTLFWHPDGPLLDANDAFLAMVGRTRADLDAGRLDWRAITPPEYQAIDDEKVAELFRDGAHAPYEKEYLRADGSRVAVVVASAFLEDSRERGISLIVDVTDRWILEAARSELLASEREARLELQAANWRLERIADASAALVRASTPEEVLDSLVASLHGSVGSFVALFVADGELLRRVRTAHDSTAAVADLSGRYPVPTSSGSPVALAYRSGSVQVFGEMSPELARTVSESEEYLRTIDSLRIAGGLAVPMRARRRHHGVVVVARGPDEAPLAAEDRSMVQTIADRAAAAFLNTSDLEAERAIATRLQRALLPTGLAVPDGHTVGTLYLPAGRGHEVGGDWWDVVPLAGGRYAIAVGDAMGHGVGAAAVMAEMRNATRALLAHGASPADALNTASGLLQVTRPGEMATVFLAVYAPDRDELAYSVAGHPPALLVQDGAVERLDAVRGTPLGVDVAPRTNATVPLRGRFALAAYSDGLVESPALPIDEGIDRLAAALVATGDVEAQERAERIAAELAGTDDRDDVCLVIFTRER